MPSSVIPSPSTRQSFSQHSERGVALVITLSFLLIATAIIIAFLTRSRFDVQASANYSASIQSDLLAAGAADQIVANFIEEIAWSGNSATHSMTSSSGEKLTWFEPIKGDSGTFSSMVPYRATPLGSDGPFRNLIKQSRPGQPFFEGQPEPPKVSDISTLQKSGNNRMIDAKRWDLPKLTGDVSGPAEFSDDNVPYWIYLKFNGETTTAKPTSPSEIVGRFAYNVYQVGGLLNINVAGHNGATDSDIATKGALAFADLTKIPGLSEAYSDIVNWRAPDVNWGSTGNMSDAINLSNPTLLDYLRLGSNVGWLRNPSGVARQGNQFLSRRDLLKYFNQKGLPETALPYLTHFSVDVDAPSFSPNVDPQNPEAPALPIASVTPLKENVSGSVISLARQAKINPARYRSDSVIDIPMPDGTSQSAPVLNKRFPLSRLGYVETNPENRTPATSSTLIQRYFGLVPVDDYTWQYKDMEGSTNRIKTLDEVAAAQASDPDRRPNFFEILKSSIQLGSLGQYKQRPQDQPELSIEPNADRIDEHVLRIGAAIIDQADKDSYPTRILFNDDGDATSFGEIYGVEDLPYIYYVRMDAYRTRPYAERGKRAIMLQPSLWNPHNPDRSLYPPGNNPPSEFKVTAKSIGGPVSIPLWEPYGMSKKTFLPDVDYINFKWEPSHLTFRQPQGLLSSSYPVQAQVEASAVGKDIPIVQQEHYNNNWPYNPFPLNALAVSGFKLGETTAETSSLPIIGDGDSERRNLPYAPAVVGQPVEFVLSYTAPDGNEYAYDRLWLNPNPTNFRATFGGRSNPFSNNNNYMRLGALYLKADPRSQRFIFTNDQAKFSDEDGGSQNRDYRFDGKNETPIATPLTNMDSQWGYFGKRSVPETLGLGWYQGIASTFVNVLNPIPTWWTFGTDVTGGTAKDLRRDIGYLTVNSRKVGSRGIYYRDNDGVVRRAMAGAATVPQVSMNSEREIGFKIPSSTGHDNIQRAVGLPTQMTAGTNEVQAVNAHRPFPNRPIVLNRPFRSVGELAYAFRDVPWKNIDFTFAESGDSGLLDVFTVYENEKPTDGAFPLVAGKVNLNASPLPVLEALLEGTALAAKTDIGNSPPLLLNDTDISTVAQKISNYRASDVSASPLTGGPYRSLADLVGRLATGGTQATFLGLNSTEVSNTTDATVLPEQLSASIRALADVATARTWNVMIDIVAQTGRVPQDSGLEDFIVASESRWWLFVSIDRFTGKVLARSIERVVE